MKNNVLKIYPRGVENLAVSAKRPVPASYEIINSKGDKVKRVLTDNLTVVEIPRDQSVQALQMILTSSTNWVYEFDLNRPGLDKEKLKKFWEEHPFVLDATIPDGKQPLFKSGAGDSSFYFSSSVDELNQSLNNDKSRVEAYLKYSNLEEADQRKVAVYFGVQEQKYDNEELFELMASLDYGVVVSDGEDGYGANRAEFLENLENMFDEYRLNLKLAINNSVLFTDGNSLLVGGIAIGLESNINDCILTLKSRDDLYAILIRELRNASLQPYGDNSKLEEEAKKNVGGKQVAKPKMPEPKFEAAKA
jgi:hypothetical protein